MFIERISYRKVSKTGGIIGSMKGKLAIIGNDGWSFGLAYIYHSAFDDRILYLNSYFVSGYKGSNYASQKDICHYTPEMIKIIRQLDNSFKILNGKATSKNFTIKVVEFGREAEVGEEEDRSLRGVEV